MLFCVLSTVIILTDDNICLVSPLPSWSGHVRGVMWAGAHGVDGAHGVVGYDGIDGVYGVVGDDGIDGVVGVLGDDGIDFLSFIFSII